MFLVCRLRAQPSLSLAKALSPRAAGWGGGGGEKPVFGGKAAFWLHLVAPALISPCLALQQHHRALQERSGAASGGGERAKVGPAHPGAQRSAPLAAEGPGEPQVRGMGVWGGMRPPRVQHWQENVGVG